MMIVNFSWPYLSTIGMSPLHHAEARPAERAAAPTAAIAALPQSAAAAAERPITIAQRSMPGRIPTAAAAKPGRRVLLSARAAEQERVNDEAQNTHDRYLPPPCAIARRANSRRIDRAAAGEWPV
jgi:hypothetical protein